MIDLRRFSLAYDCFYSPPTLSECADWWKGEHSNNENDDNLDAHYDGKKLTGFVSELISCGGEHIKCCRDTHDGHHVDTIYPSPSRKQHKPSQPSIHDAKTTCIALGVITREGNVGYKFPMKFLYSFIPSAILESVGRLIGGDLFGTQHLKTTSTSQRFIGQLYEHTPVTTMRTQASSWAECSVRGMLCSFCGGLRRVSDMRHEPFQPFSLSCLAGGFCDWMAARDGLHLPSREQGGSVMVFTVHVQDLSPVNRCECMGYV